MLFFTAKPRTHVYVFFTPWASAGGHDARRAWLAVRKRVRQPVAATVGAVVAVRADPALRRRTRTCFSCTQTWRSCARGSRTGPPATGPPGTRWTTARCLAFPCANGWKVAGVSTPEGEIERPLRNQRVRVLDAGLVYARRVALRRSRRLVLPDFQSAARPGRLHDARSRHTVEKEYEPWGQVDHRRRPAHAHPPAQPRALRRADVSAGSVRRPPSTRRPRPTCRLSYPVVEPSIAHPLHANLGDAVRLEGYDLDYDAPLQPGDTLCA